MTSEHGTRTETINHAWRVRIINATAYTNPWETGSYLKIVKRKIALKIALCCQDLIAKMLCPK